NIINLPKKDDNHKISTLYFEVDDLKQGQGVTISFEDKHEGNATIIDDYTYKNNSITNPILIDNNHPNAPFTLDIEAKTDRTRSAILYITVSDNGPLPQKHIFKLVLNFNTKVVTPNVDNPVFLPDTSRWYLRIVTGGNFDFFNGPTIKDFAGDISLFLPNTFNIGKVSFGFELGMNNYHYFNTDSSHTAPDNF